MHKLLFVLLTVLVATNASAKAYGNHDPKRLLTVSETPAGKKYGFDGAYLDRMLNDLSAHAKNYPPQFDTPEDKQRAIRDVRTLSGMLDSLIKVPAPDPEILFRAAYVNSMGHNLDIPGAADKADAIFLKLLAAKPSDPRGNFAYGAFLVGAGKSKEALPYLEKALSAGVADAAYAIGMTHLALGDKERARKSFEDYKRRNPKDGNVDTIIEGIRSGKVEIRKNPG
jgi:tetratricopeptide (TPR) repeat protein